MRRARLGHEHGGADGGGGPEWQVDEEHEAPAAERVHADEQPADDRAEDRRATDHRPEERERLRQLVLREDRAHDPEPLRDQQRTEGTLGETEARRAFASRSRGRKPSEQSVNPAAPITKMRRLPNRSPKPSAEDQPDRERERVAAGDPLQGGIGGVQVAADRRQRDVDDRSVEEIHALGGEDDAEDPPAARDGRVTQSSSLASSSFIVPNTVR